MKLNKIESSHVVQQKKKKKNEFFLKTLEKNVFSNLK